MHRITQVRVPVTAIVWVLLTIGLAAPADAAGPGVTSLAVGDYHACVTRTDGSAWCWGNASGGQVGDGTTGDSTTHLRTTPVRVRRGSTFLTGVTEVAVGSSQSCAVRSDASAWCWGNAAHGEVGDGTTGDPTFHLRTKAVRVRRGGEPLTGVKHVAVGAGHACALRTDGTVWCWGNDDEGQLGDGTTGDPTDHIRTTAVRVRRGSGHLDKVVAIAAGYGHTCAIRKDGSAWCWGNGRAGELGDGVAAAGHHRTKATHVKLGGGYLTGASGIAASGAHTCVRRTDSSTWCWGYAEIGQLGDGTTGDPTDHVRTKPVKVRRGSGFLTGVTAVGTGVEHSCARRSDGSAWCWGNDRYGELGDGTTGDSTTHLRLKAVRVVRSAGAFTGVRKLDGGEYHTCALRTDRSVWCWGDNAFGQLGRGSADTALHRFPGKVSFP
jgi:alpha-tubulin suppressor-like RCC1 family protein